MKGCPKKLPFHCSFQGGRWHRHNYPSSVLNHHLQAKHAPYGITAPDIHLQHHRWPHSMQRRPGVKSVKWLDFLSRPRLRRRKAISSPAHNFPSKNITCSQVISQNLLHLSTHLNTHTSPQPITRPLIYLVEVLLWSVNKCTVQLS